MIVHINLLTDFLEFGEHLEFNYEKTKIISTYTIEDYDRFVNFIEYLKKYDKEIIIDEKWYSIEDYVFEFPKNFDYMPVLKIYVSEAY